MKKVIVLIGNYGSGKTELALNFAFRAAETGRTELLDLDMVNTYFRLTERGRMVRQKEIRLVSPNYACSGVETLSLPAEVASAFDMDWDTVVFDVGGDAVGSTALGRYHSDFMHWFNRSPEKAYSMSDGAALALSQHRSKHFFSIALSAFSQVFSPKWESPEI